MSDAASSGRPGAPRGRQPRGVAPPTRRALPGVVVPQDCPIVPIGISGLTLYALNALGQLTVIPGDRIGIGTCETLFCGERGWLCEKFQKLHRDGRAVVKGVFDHVAFATWLRAACGSAGPFDPEALRGRGAWLGEGGDLIVHYGDQLWVFSRKATLRPWRCAPGRHGEFIYPTRPSLPLPAMPGLRGCIDTGPAQSCLRALHGWQFTRGELDELFMLGFLGQAFVAGARRSRSSMIVSGDTLSGKSQLIELTEALLGEWCLVSNDATAAGVRQHLGIDVLVVIIDEAEAGGGPQRRTQNLELIRLIRACYGGGGWLRGGADHEGAGGELRFPLLLAAITPPPLRPEDRSRVVQLHLATDLAAVPAPEFLAQAGTVGRQMAARLLTNWGRLHECDDVAWQDALAEAGIAGRQAQTLVNLLACASVLLTEPDGLLALIARHRAGLAALGDTLARDRRRLWQEMLTELRALAVPAERSGEPVRPLGELWLRAAGYGPFEPDEVGDNPGMLGLAAPPQGEREARTAAQSDPARRARHRLAQLGFAIADDGPTRVLLIARYAPALVRLLRDSALGERADGGVTNLLAGAPSARWWPEPIAFTSGKEPALAISLELALAGMVGPDRIGTAEAWDQYNQRG